MFFVCSSYVQRTQRTKTCRIQVVHLAGGRTRRRTYCHLSGSSSPPAPPEAPPPAVGELTPPGGDDEPDPSRRRRSAASAKPQLHRTKPESSKPEQVHMVGPQIFPSNACLLLTTLQSQPPPHAMLTSCLFFKKAKYLFTTLLLFYILSVILRRSAFMYKMKFLCRIWGCMYSACQYTEMY